MYAGVRDQVFYRTSKKEGLVVRTSRRMSIEKAQPPHARMVEEIETQIDGRR